MTGKVSIYGVRVQHPEAWHSQGKFLDAGFTWLRAFCRIPEAAWEAARMLTLCSSAPARESACKARTHHLTSMLCTATQADPVGLLLLACSQSALQMAMRPPAGCDDRASKSKRLCQPRLAGSTSGTASGACAAPASSPWVPDNLPQAPRRACWRACSVCWPASASPCPGQYHTQLQQHSQAPGGLQRVMALPGYQLQHAGGRAKSLCTAAAGCTGPHV